MQGGTSPTVAASTAVAHPNRGSGPTFRTKHAFDMAYAFVGPRGITFQSTPGERITARQGWTKDGQTPTIVFHGKTRHGSVCVACWGYRISCSGSRIGQCAEALDRIIQ